ncbi:hypothetical protein [Evansella tamaricis]|uniref:Uncharacterized protein n=1 Tax=Evansella tamaricis TaxID=2069301 RepID=A0ABS6JBM8_9BACI|nr:hypothetical protein [Evansella tamaricis]MBU9711055.1 hypothetical protein [Evansella tamaricis]
MSQGIYAEQLIYAEQMYNEFLTMRQKLGEIVAALNDLGVDVNNLPSVQTVDGEVTIANLPDTQTVDGEVNIGNLPSVQNVSDSQIEFVIAAINELQTVAEDLRSRLDTTLQVSDEDISSKISILENLIQGIVDGTTKVQTETQVTGSNLEESESLKIRSRSTETSSILPRSIRKNSATPIVITPPEGAKGIIMVHTVHGISGTFNSNQGFRLRMFIVDSLSIYHTSHAAFTNWTTLPSGQSLQMISFYPTAQGETSESQQRLHVPILPYPRIRINLDISGLFEGVQGVDSELNAHWIF